MVITTGLLISNLSWKEMGTMDLAYSWGDLTRRAQALEP